MAKILLADDDRSARTSFKALFEAEGHDVVLSKNGEEAVSLFRKEIPDLVLLDVMMPRKNGIAACAEIRALDPQVPILFFTAMPSEVSLVRGLGMGADDYIAKNRPPEEFLARVGAALRRRAVMSGTTGTGGCVVRLGATEVDPATMYARSEAGEEHLTRSEMLVVRVLAAERGKVVGYARFFSALGGDGYVGNDEAVRKIVQRLKRKLGRGGELIVGERGIGYRLLA